jgi:hypothetical protein
MRQYIGLIHKESASDYGVSFPDFPGVVTAGKIWTMLAPWLRKPLLCM